MKEKNIILVGMPNSEKNTIGKILSNKLGFKYVDTNQYMKAAEGKSQADLANAAALKLAPSSLSVISTEAEVINRHPDITELRKNGVVIFIDNNKMLKDSDYDANKRCCDLHLVNDNCVDDIVDYLCTLWS